MNRLQRIYFWPQNKEATEWKGHRKIKKSGSGVKKLCAYPKNFEGKFWLRRRGIWTYSNENLINFKSVYLRVIRVIRVQFWSRVQNFKRVTNISCGSTDRRWNIHTESRSALKRSKWSGRQGQPRPVVVTLPHPRLIPTQSVTCQKSWSVR